MPQVASQYASLQQTSEDAPHASCAVCSLPVVNHDCNSGATVTLIVSMSMLWSLMVELLMIMSYIQSSPHCEI